MTETSPNAPQPPPFISDDIDRLVRFFIETDLLKSVERRGVVPSAGGRRENAAEHSWHVTLIALMLHPRLSVPVDLFRTMQLIAIHDLCEIYAGDTYAYDPAAMQGQADREEVAATRLFAIAPTQDQVRLHALRGEFEAGDTPEARFAHACDRVAGFMQNIIGEGSVWKELGISRDRTYPRMAPPLAFDPVTAGVVKALYAIADEGGMWPSQSRVSATG